MMAAPANTNTPRMIATWKRESPLAGDEGCSAFSFTAVSFSLPGGPAGFAVGVGGVGGLPPPAGRFLRGGRRSRGSPRHGCARTVLHRAGFQNDGSRGIGRGLGRPDNSRCSGRAGPVLYFSGQ